jgi:hypothetical protein
MLTPPAETTPPTSKPAKETEPVTTPEVVAEVLVEAVPQAEVTVVVEDKEEEETGDSEKA